ncbi:hypothetical protein [Paenibacillus sp. MDMC362]|uniref:hypothetical protein n=1 Tax=Paenibacillus sp. MDMC362 TaxID=2977365 RepID=UPI000DC490E0|nr:hypothetical protein [Paenibacillus sp. MDMC362]RAR44168.1 hypothetical protein DP091_09080 [Paenibacillus sp. MDMC362]
MAYNRFGFGNLVGRKVKINRGGPDSIEGLLLDAQSDYLIAVADGGFVYVKDDHVKSITDTGKSGGARESIVNPITAYNFVGVMQALRYRLVKINRGGPEKLEGIIVDVNQNYLILTVKGQEVVHIPVSHIKSITVVRGGGNNKSGSNQNQNSNSQGNQSNQSQGNRSGGNQSGGNQGGNRAGGNQSGGNQSGGNRAGGNQSGGNRTGGNQTRGNQTRGNQTGGDWMNWTGGNQSKNRSGKRNRSGNRSNNRSGNRNRSGKRRSGGE